MNDTTKIEPVTKEMYLVANLTTYDNTFSLSIDMWKPSNNARCILLETFSITRETDFTHDQLTQMQLSKLDVVDQALRATHYMDIKENEEIRQSLLAITHQPEVENTGGEFPADDPILMQTELEAKSGEYRDSVDPLDL